MANHPLLLTRRRLMLAGAAAAGLGATPGLAPIAWARQYFSTDPFGLGVASGDPAPDGFVIWTRLAPQPLAPSAGLPHRAIPVRWEVAEDSRFTTAAAKGETLARPELGHSVHVEVTGLKPARPYFYRFRVGSDASPYGRVRTAPAAGAPVARVRLAQAGCQAYEDGLYTAYRHLAAEDELDAVFHYGDYIYEGRSNAIRFDRAADARIPTVRRHASDTCYSLDDYRGRYAQTKADADLQAAHHAAAFIPAWDDHETVNNWAGDSDGDVPPEVFALRKAAAAQAYYENMPLRAAAFPRGGSIALNRRLQWGDLLTAHVLDTRSHRTDQPCGDGFKLACAGQGDPRGTLLGAAQERWLGEGLAAARTRWNGLLQQVMVSDFDRTGDAAGAPTFNMDTWAGYHAGRRRVLEGVAARNITNLVVLTGDEHQSFAQDVRLAPAGARAGEGRTVASEFVATSISSGGDGVDARPDQAEILRRNPHCRFRSDRRGYHINDITPDSWRVTVRTLDSVSAPGAAIKTAATFAVAREKPGVQAG